MNNNLKNCWIQITAGQGPDECALAVRLATLRLIKEAQKNNVQSELINTTLGNNPDAFLSSLINLKGDNLEQFINKWQGSIQWICKSPLRPFHKRKNWFIRVDAIIPTEFDTNELNEKDIVFTSIKASGPGGQHVNTTGSAVRATHKPTGLIVVAREERSQYMNKKLAMARLSALLEEESKRLLDSTQKDKWSKHTQIQRGNPVRVFEGLDFKEKSIRPK